jgi:hypothetical protein
VKLLKKFFGSIAHFFKSGKAEKAFATVADLVPDAFIIVETIAALTPNKTDDEIASVYNRYGVPLMANVMATPASQRGYLLLELATQVLAERRPGLATNLLHTAVQNAVTIYKANKGK